MSGSEIPALLDLVREIQAGRAPEENFRRIYDRCAGPVLHFFLRRGFSKQEAEDLTQEVFVRVHNHLGDFRFESKFETWLFQIVGNTWKNALRGKGALKRSSEKLTLDDPRDVDEGPPDPRDDGEDPLAQVLAEEKTRVLYTALGKLPVKMRDCVMLRVGHELKYREIAVILRVSVSTVKSQLNAANQRLKPLLERHPEVFGD